MKAFQLIKHVLFYCLIITCPQQVYSDTYNWTLLGPGDADQVTSLTVLENGDVFAGLDIGGLYKSLNKGNAWNPVNNGLNNLDITTKVIQNPDTPDVLLVGTRGGLYKSTNYGQTWNRKAGGLPEIEKYKLSGSIGSILLDPFNSNIVYTALGYRPSSDGTSTVKKMAGEQHIYKSSDGGENWIKLSAFPKPSKVTQLYHSPTLKNTIYAATSTGLYASSNAGKKWNLLFNKRTLNIAIDYKSPGVIYAACNEDGIYKSTDAGITWDNIYSNINLGSRFKNRYSTVLIDPKNTQLIYAINSTWGRAGGLYSSDDAGENWNLISKNMPESWLSTSKRMNDLAISQKAPNHIYLGSSRYIYASQDAGKSWQQKISRKIDGGWSHTGINVFGQTRVIKIDPDDKKIIYIGTADHKILKSINGGESWNLLLENDRDANYVWDINICSGEENTINIVTSNNNKNICFMHSKDKGESWKKNCSFTEKARWKEKIRVAPDNCNEILLSSHNNLYKSSDSGDTWKSINHNFREHTIRAIEYDPDNSSIYYVGTNKGLYVSNDSGTSWELAKNTNHLTITSIHKRQSKNNELFIGTQLSNKRPAEIYKSTDNGHTWKIVLSGLRRYISAITTLPANQNIIYASTLDDNYHDESMGAGIFRSADKGNTWHRIDMSLPVHRAYEIATSKAAPFNVYLSTNGSGAYIANEKNHLSIIKKNLSK